MSESAEERVERIAYGPAQALNTPGNWIFVHKEDLRAEIRAAESALKAKFLEILDAIAMIGDSEGATYWNAALAEVRHRLCCLEQEDE